MNVVIFTGVVGEKITQTASEHNGTILTFNLSSSSRVGNRIWLHCLMRGQSADEADIAPGDLATAKGKLSGSGDRAVENGGPIFLETSEIVVHAYGEPA